MYSIIALTGYNYSTLGVVRARGGGAELHTELWPLWLKGNIIELCRNVSVHIRVCSVLGTDPYQGSAPEPR